MRGALALLVLAACSGEAQDGVCPELASESAEWTALGDDPLCAELAEYLNGGLDLGDSGECPDGRVLIERRNGVCVAELAAECDGTRLELECVQLASGGADCDATVYAAELGGGCDYWVAIR